VRKGVIEILLQSVILERFQIKKAINTDFSPISPVVNREVTIEQAH